MFLSDGWWGTRRDSLLEALTNAPRHDMINRHRRSVALFKKAEVLQSRFPHMALTSETMGIADLVEQVECMRARLDAQTRAVLWVEPVDEDVDYSIVKTASLAAAHGAARRNREDFELGDDY